MAKKNTTKQSAQAKNVETKGKKGKKGKEKVPSVVMIERTAKMPALDGTLIEMSVEMFRVTGAELDKLAKQGLELTDEEKVQLFSKKKDAIAWLQDKRAEARGERKRMSKGEKQGLRVYRAQKSIKAIVDDGAMDKALLAQLEATIATLDEVINATGFDAAAWETEQFKKQQEKQAKKAANS